MRICPGRPFSRSNRGAALTRHARAGALAILVVALLGCGTQKPEQHRMLDAAPPVIRTTVLGGTPGALVVTRDAVWVVDARGGRLIAVDPVTARVSGPPVAIEAPLAIAAGEGAVWVASGTGEVSRVDAESRRVTSLARVRDPGGIAAGFGSIWVTSRRDGTISALDPESGDVRGRPLRTGAVPGDVAIGFGSVWVANMQDATVTRIDGRSRRPLADAISVADAQILALTTGEGGVWVAATDSAQNAGIELRRIDPDTAAVDDDAVALPRGVPIELTAGLGSIWATDVGNLIPGTPARGPALLRIAASERVRAGRPIALGAQPSGVATGAGAVWVTSAGDSALRRIVPGVIEDSASGGR